MKSTIKKMFILLHASETNIYKNHYSYTLLLNNSTLCEKFPMNEAIVSNLFYISLEFAIACNSWFTIILFKFVYMFMAVRASSCVIIIYLIICYTPIHFFYITLFPMHTYTVCIVLVFLDLQNFLNISMFVLSPKSVCLLLQ
jgi:hypothetical protein